MLNRLRIRRDLRFRDRFTQCKLTFLANPKTTSKTLLISNKPDSRGTGITFHLSLRYRSVWTDLYKFPCGK